MNALTSETLTDIGGGATFYSTLVEVTDGWSSMHEAVFQCAGCFEWVETTVDESGGSRQVYVEDCQVCCQPNVA